MLLVHLVTQGLPMGVPWQQLFGEYLRFAAGGFIFVAGISIGAIYLPRCATPEGRWRTYLALWRRALLLLMVHMAAELMFLLRWPLLGGEPFADLWTPVLDVLLLRNAGTDLLLFYVVVLAASPLLLALLRRRLWWLLAGLSAVTFGLAQDNPYFLSPPIFQVFLVWLWQGVFVAGVLFGAVLPRYDAAPRWVKRGLLIGSATAATALTLLAHVPNLGAWLNVGLHFWKVPLTLGEAMRYLSMTLTIVFASDLAWRRLEETALVRFMALLGRHSLPVYVAHVWVVALTVHVAVIRDISGSATLVLAATGLATLGLIAWLFDNRRQHGRESSPRLVYEWVGLLMRGFGAVTASLLVVFFVNAAMRQTLYPEPSPVLLGDAVVPAAAPADGDHAVEDLLPAPAAMALPLG